MFSLAEVQNIWNWTSYQYFVMDMVEPSEDDDDDVLGPDELIAFFVILILVPSLALFLKRWKAMTMEGELKRRAKEDTLRDEIMAFLSSPPSLMNSCPVTCAICQGPTTFSCKSCKSVKYCSVKCQLEHWHQGHRDDCKEWWHDSGAISYGVPAWDASQHMPLSSNFNYSPLWDTDPFPTKGSNMDSDSYNSNRSVYTSDNDVTYPSENFLVNKVLESNNNFSYSDAMSVYCDVIYPDSSHQPSICTPDTRKRQNASTMVSKPYMGINLTSGVFSSCERTHVSSTQPLQRNLSSGITVEHEALQQILIDVRAKPMMMSYAVLEDITNNFSTMIGRGGSGEVYMGILGDGKVAVKKLHNTESFTEKQFEEELTCLIRVEHKNIVRLIGYCSDTQQKVVEYNGRHVLADMRRRFLCFEYAPNKSLDDYLKDESHGRDLDTCYQMIEGICHGLQYLHNKESITHMDLKPGNILLDANMVPKIADFGLSRRFSGAESRIITKNLRGSLGYIAPELVKIGEISLKSDIFSLGVIIKNILMGSTDLSDFENWQESLDIDCPKFRSCIRIAQICMNNDPRKRPTIDCIVDMLNGKKEDVQTSLRDVAAPNDTI